MKEKKEYGKIIISDDYYITRLDKYCLALMKRITREKKDTGEKYLSWEIAGYHGDLSNALLQAYKEMEKDNLFSENLNIKEVVKKLQENQKEMQSLFKNIKITL